MVRGVILRTSTAWLHELDHAQAHTEAFYESRTRAMTSTTLASAAITNRECRAVLDAVKVLAELDP